ncbi:MAG: PQQ-binding-like beta-propeller repeat protein [Planctomycetota bacterium]
MKTAIALVVCFFSAQALRASDWPQFGGPLRDGVSTETGLLKQWPESGPKLIWMSKDVGLGYSGPAIVGGRIYLMGLRGESELLLCLNAADGKELWATPIGSAYTNDYGDGPRGTPTVDGERIYMLGANGDLVCAGTASGTVHWRVKVTDFGGMVPPWGYCESVLVDGDRVVCTPGGEKGAMAAFEKLSGKLVWQSAKFTDPAQYASIAAADIAGTHLYIQVTGEHVTGIAAADGRMLWQQPFKCAYVCASPVVKGDHVFVTSGGGTGCKSFHVLAPDKVELVYKNKVMKNLPGGVVLFGEHLYGYSDGLGWVCQHFATGEQVWASKEFRKGSLTIADGMMICVAEDDGTVVLADASEKGWKERSHFQLDPLFTKRKQGHVWTLPVVVGGRLYLRDQEFLFCFDIAAH